MKKNKQLAVFLFVVGLLLVLSVTSFATDSGEERTNSLTSPIEDFTYEVNTDGTVTITKYIGSDIDVVIPDTIEGFPVTKIGDYAIYNSNTIRTITLGDSVTSIGEYAFAQSLSGYDKAVYRLTNVYGGTCIKEIGKYAFYGNNNLISVPSLENLTEIPEGAFYECYHLESICIDNVTSIGDYAFLGCRKLSSISSPVYLTDRYYKDTVYEVSSLENVTSIGRNAFSGCDNLRRMIFPKNPTYLANNIANFKSVDYSLDVPFFLVLCDSNDLAKSYCEKERLYSYQNNVIPQCIYLHDEELISEGTTTSKSNLVFRCKICGNIDTSKGNLVYFVTFKDYNGDILAEEIIDDGYSAIAPEVPERKGYTFIGWDKEFDVITEDLTITAQYEKNSEDANDEETKVSFFEGIKNFFNKVIKWFKTLFKIS